MIKPCCGDRRHPTNLQHDLVYVDKLELFNDRLYDDIDFRTRAMKNWQKLRILIVLFQICGKNSLDSTKKKEQYEEEEKEKVTCTMYLAHKIIDPANKYKVMWDLSIGIVYLVSFVIDPVVFAFKFEPLQTDSLRIFSDLVTIVFIIDILLVPFTGVYKDETEMQEEKDKKKKEKDLNEKPLMRRGRMRKTQNLEKDQGRGIDDPVLERDICNLLKRYFKGDAIIDILANVPGCIYVYVLGPEGEGDNVENLWDDRIFLTFMALKILRLFHVDEVFDSFKRLFDKLGNIFILYSYMFDNLLKWFLTCLKFVLFVHYFACGWVIIMTVKDLVGIKRLEFVEETIFYQYIESFYLITTTITTVGFGDYKAFNDEDPVWASEMCYLFVVTLAGIILFSLVTNEIFSYKKIKTVN